MRKHRTKLIRRQAKHKKGEGCATCGGYGVVMFIATFLCGHKGWVRPGGRSVYEGKVWTTIDGPDVVHRAAGTRCVACDEAGICD